MLDDKLFFASLIRTGNSPNLSSLATQMQMFNQQNQGNNPSLFFNTNDDKLTNMMGQGF